MPHFYCPRMRKEVLPTLSPHPPSFRIPDRVAQLMKLTQKKCSSKLPKT